MPEQVSLLALASHVIRPLDARTYLVIRADNGAAAAMDARWAPFLRHLQVFRTLDQHVDALIGIYGDLRPHADVLRRALETMAARGVFVAGEDLARELITAADRDAAAPPRVVIQTCDRPSTLSRLLDSLIANEDRYGNRWSYEVIDDSRSPGSADNNRDLVQSAAARLDIRYVGQDARAAFVDALVARFPGDEASMRWLLDSGCPDMEAGPTIAVPINHAFLRHAGHRVLLVDDDAVFRAWKMRGTDMGGPAFGGPGAAVDVMVFVTMEEAFDQLEEYRKDPIAVHAGVLGMSVGRALSAWKPNPDGRVFGGSSIRDLERLRPASARVRYTSTGLVGDTGTIQDLYLFNPTGALGELARDHERYLRLRGAERVLYRSSGAPLFHNDGWYQQATCGGFDASGYVPPLYPVGRAPDALVGGLFRHLFPHDMALQLPFALEHRAAVPRKWRIHPDALDTSPATNDALITWLSSFEAGGGGSHPETVMLGLADRLAGELDEGLFSASASGLLRRRRNENLSQLYHSLVGALSGAADAGAQWREDVRNLIQHTAALMRSDNPEAPATIAAVDAGLKRYAAAVPAWNRAFRSCLDDPVVTH